LLFRGSFLVICSFLIPEDLWRRVDLKDGEFAMAVPSSIELGPILPKLRAHAGPSCDLRFEGQGKAVEPPSHREDNNRTGIKAI